MEKMSENREKLSEKISCNIINYYLYLFVYIFITAQPTCGPPRCIVRRSQRYRPFLGICLPTITHNSSKISEIFFQYFFKISTDSFVFDITYLFIFLISFKFYLTFPKELLKFSARFILSFSKFELIYPKYS